MEIVAFKSEYTGELFDDEVKYKKHLKKFEAKKQEEDKVKEAQKQFNELRHQPRLTATSIEDFKEKFFTVASKLKSDKGVRLTHVNFDRMRFSESVSNTHSSPIGFPQNFSQKDGLPKGYQGWDGQITFVYSKDSSFTDNIRDIIERFPGINTGSGGYKGKEFEGKKGYVLSYELRLYLEDFPLIKQQYEQYQELCSKKEAWEDSIEEAVTFVNDGDISLIGLYESLTTQTKELADIRVRINETENSIYDIKESNKENILKENPFTLENELNEVSKQFN